MYMVIASDQVETQRSNITTYNAIMNGSSLPHTTCMQQTGNPIHLMQTHTSKHTRYTSAENPAVVIILSSVCKIIKKKIV